jgi:hypothetical protein
MENIGLKAPSENSINHFVRVTKEQIGGYCPEWNNIILDFDKIERGYTPKDILDLIQTQDGYFSDRFFYFTTPSYRDEEGFSHGGEKIGIFIDYKYN